MASRYASRQLNKLCDACQAVFPIDGPWYWEKERARSTEAGSTVGVKIKGGWLLRDFSIHDLHTSAEAGCHLCRIFLDSLLPPDMIVGNRHGYSNWYETHKDVELQCQLAKAWDSKTLELPLSLHIPGQYSYIRTIGKKYLLRTAQSFRFQPVRLLHAGQDSDSTTWVADLDFVQMRTASLSGRPFKIVQPFSTTNFNTSSFAQLRKWLTECLECHDECTNWKPALCETYDYQRKIRFVDVGTEKSPVFRLVDGQSLFSETDGIKYVTLSYRWTTETEVTSMKSYNKALYHELIPTNILPQVYKDAATVARALGVRYVWIDSLCIIQDSRDDWNKQSSMMDQIYAYGLLNLSSMLADRAQGLEIHRDPLAISPCILSRRLPTNAGRGEKLYKHWICIEGYGANSFIDLAPLFKRAWCYQERVLPSRTVYFGEQLVWLCQRSMASESFPSWICRGPNIPLFPMSKYAQRQHNPMGGFPFTDTYAGVKSPDEIWGGIAKLYSRTDITKQTDRLVALRGIFNRLAGFFKETEPDWCVAGLWKASLVKQLLWERDGKIDKSNPQEVARANEAFELFPSWSWASCGTGISIRSFLVSSKHHVVDMIQVVSIQPDQPLGSEATYTAFESSSRIVLQGLIDAKFDSGRVAETWTTDDTMSELEVVMSYDTNWVINFDTDIVFDRPMLETIKHEDLKLLPIRLYWQVYNGCEGIVAGLLVESLGVREGIPGYRRMGTFMAYCESEIMPPGMDHVEKSAEGMDKAMGGLREKRGQWPVLQLV